MAAHHWVVVLYKSGHQSYRMEYRMPIPLHRKTANRISPIIVQNAEKYSVDPLLLAAMIRQESSYRNYVVSPAGAVGLTQVIPRCGKKHALETCLKKTLILIVEHISWQNTMIQQEAGRKL